MATPKATELIYRKERGHRRQKQKQKFRTYRKISKKFVKTKINVVTKTFNNILRY